MRDTACSLVLLQKLILKILFRLTLRERNRYRSASCVGLKPAYMQQIRRVNSRPTRNRSCAWFSGPAITVWKLMTASPTEPDRFDAIVVAYGSEPLLEECVVALLASTSVQVRVIVVDNGCTHPVVARLKQLPGVEWLHSPRNIGFAGGVNSAEPLMRHEFVALINSDVIVGPEVLFCLSQALKDECVGLAMPMVLRRSDGRINTAGNPLHLLGFSWAGSNGEDAKNFTQPALVPAASGAALALRRTTWMRLGGFPNRFFLYQEDVDLSIACHQAELKILLEPRCYVTHDYDWGRNPGKLYFAERNRLAIILTRYPLSLIARLAPMILLTELGALVFGGFPGARGAKIRGYVWLIQNISWIRGRRKENFRRATNPWGFLSHTTARFDSSAPGAGIGPRVLNALLPTYASATRLSRLAQARAQRGGCSE